MKPLLISCMLSFSTVLFAQDQDSTLIDQFELVKVMPNPTSEIIFIKNGEQIDSYQLFSTTGELIQSGNRNPQIISLLDYPLGNYILILEIDQVYKSFRVVKY